MLIYYLTAGGWLKQTDMSMASQWVIAFECWPLTPGDGSREATMSKDQYEIQQWISRSQLGIQLVFSNNAMGTWRQNIPAHGSGNWEF